MTPLIPFLCLLLFGPGAYRTACAAEKDSLKAQFYASVSVRNPTLKERIVSRADGTADTVGIPFDYEVASGITGSYGTLHFVMDYQYERQDDIHYVNQEYSLRHRTTAYEVGVRLRDAEEDKLYILSGYVEGKLFGWIGVGVTRQHLRAWFNEGATLARFSLARNTFHVFKLDLTVRAEYEINPSRNRIYFYADITNFRFGRFAVVPFYRHERVKPATGAARSSYQGKIKLTINI